MKTLHILLFAIACAACTTNNADTFTLDHARILAVRSEPAHAPIGGTVRIDVLAGNDAGDVYVAVPDAIDIGTLAAQRESDGWYVTGPGVQLAPAATVTIAIDGVAFSATKELVFGDSADNPMIGDMQVDGSAIQAIDIAQNTKPALDATTAGAEPLSFAWYTSLGTLEHYREPEATFDADQAGDGTIAVVVRDAQGGVAWQIVPASVTTEP
ncbi:MAG TPA: hypothetical protein VF403_13155 [Kofleriaceae bacterium]